MTLQTRTPRSCRAIGRFTRAGTLSLGAALAALLVGVGASAPATAAEPEPTHVFDAALSLTGNCETSKVDPVADPICPQEAPDGAFQEPFGVAIDTYGDIYYFGRPTMESSTRIYVFDPAGRLLTEIPLYAQFEHVASMVVDSEGRLYVQTDGGAGREIYVLSPSRYSPASREIAYGNAPTEVSLGSLSVDSNIAIDRATQTMLVRTQNARNERELAEVGSYGEGNSLLRTFATGVVKYWHSEVAIDAADERIYVTETEDSYKSGSLKGPAGIHIFDFEGHLLETIEGVKTNAGFQEFTHQVSVAVDESTGHLFVTDFGVGHKNTVYELNPAGEAVSALTHDFSGTNNDNQITVDNGVHSPNSSMNPTSALSEEENPNGSYLFVPSGTQETGHLFAFGPKRLPKPPVISDEGFAVDGSTEAVLRAKVDPEELSTSYRFEYVPEETYARDIEESGAGHGFDHAVSVEAGALGGGNEAVAVSARLVGLAPGATYRFRVVAANLCEGEGAAECVVEGPTLKFATYSAPVAAPFTCPNEALRIGASALLPDCRAYELVTPADVNGELTAPGQRGPEGQKFGTPSVSAAGDKVAFLTHGGAISGLPGGGSISGDPYVASRGASGWSTVSVGLSGTESTNPWAGGFSPDLGYVTLETGIDDTGTLEVNEEYTSVFSRHSLYVRYPDGSLHPLGEGSLATAWLPVPWLISDGGGHMIFATQPASTEAPQLEPQAPPSGTATIYDRTSDGVVHVVSLLPGDVTPAAKEEAVYQGAAADGSVVAFEMESVAAPINVSPLYVRVDDATTVEVGPPGSTFAGLSADGRYGFYLAGGDLYRFDSETGASVRITESGDVTVVNIPSGGTSAYFSSPSVLGNPGEENPSGARPVEGRPNLYYWDGTSVRFVATLAEDDMDGANARGPNGTSGALNSWVQDMAGNTTALDPSRSTAAGGVIAFESHADIAGHQSDGASEVYRYDATQDTLACLSCDPTGAEASGNARLQSLWTEGIGTYSVPTGPYSEVPSLTASGGRVFFESPDALVAADTDGVQDVYEWEAEGEGTCVTHGGCVQLISSGQGGRASYLYGVSESGDDVFIATADQLTGEDDSEAPSVYDARVDGGFAPPTAVAAECLGEACQPAPQVLRDLTPASFSFEGTGNLPSAAGTCHAGKVRRHGVCVKRHSRRHPAGKRRSHRASRSCKREHRSGSRRRRCKQGARRHRRAGSVRRHARHRRRSPAVPREMHRRGTGNHRDQGRAHR